MPPEITDPVILAAAADAQKEEITEHAIYTGLARITADPRNRQVLEQIAAVEYQHYGYWKQLTKKEIAPDRIRVTFFLMTCRILGITFGIKQLERGERRIQQVYRDLSVTIPDLERILQDERDHERELIGLIDEERLRYTGSVVLGLNDALVELTGALAGFTFALQNARIIAVAGLITGIAAAFSMAAAEYLSTKSEEDGRDPFRAAMYTGVAYLITVAALIAPFLILGNLYLSLAITLVTALLVILFFSYYISVARDLPFRKRFTEMAGISLGVAALSFLMGILVRTFLGVEI
ncbi:MAG: VIT1/CCC1 transporter family protein [Methanomicrobiales archaeon]|nr:VIT1/CCC1 transporter family protein [Methanomicrobiales archaeon]